MAAVKSSFQKKIKAPTSIIGGTRCSAHNNQLLISSGVPSFDCVIGGGFPVGSVVLIDEDKNGTFAKLLVKYFLAEGAVSNHSLFIGSKDVDIKQLVCQLPGLVEGQAEATRAGDSEEGDLHQAQTWKHQNMTIAWRYQNMKLADSSPANIHSRQLFGHNFDLTKTLDEDLLKNTDVFLWDDSDGDDPKDFLNSILTSINKKLVEGKFLASEPNREQKILRIGLLRLGSPLWLPEHLPKFLYQVRCLLRASFATALITIPSHLYEDRSFMEQCIHMSDICIGLDSFTGTARERNPALKDYHGLFHIVKMAAINGLVAHMPAITDLAFKLRRKKLMIENLHLPPELEESTEREQDEAGVVCGSAGRSSKLDF